MTEVEVENEDFRMACLEFIRQYLPALKRLAQTEMQAEAKGKKKKGTKGC